MGVCGTSVTHDILAVITPFKKEEEILQERAIRVMQGIYLPLSANPVFNPGTPALLSGYFQFLASHNLSTFIAYIHNL